jgi:hypothetical protein
MAKEKSKEPSILTPQELKPILKQIGARIRDLRKKKDIAVTPVSLWITTLIIPGLDRLREDMQT